MQNATQAICLHTQLAVGRKQRGVQVPKYHSRMRTKIRRMPALRHTYRLTDGERTQENAGSTPRKRGKPPPASTRACSHARSRGRPCPDAVRPTPCTAAAQTAQAQDPNQQHQAWEMQESTHRQGLNRNIQTQAQKERKHKAMKLP